MSAATADGDGDDPVRVLHVDDEPGFAEMAASFLERENDRFDVETVTDPAAGLERLSDGTFDCVVSDYDMPDMTGIEFLRAVREEYPDLPFVLFTGKGSEEVASDAISAGVTDYLQKEGGTDQYAILANRVENVVDAHRNRKRAQRQERINTLIRTVNRRLVEAGSVEGIERAVCETLADSETYRFAWIGEPDPETGEIRPRVSAGDADSYLEEVTVRHDDSPEGRGPAGRAVRTRSVQVAQDIAADPSFEPWSGTPGRYGYRSVLVLPLVHEGTLHGILPIYADHPYAFDETEVAVLEELGGTISEAIAAAKTRRRLEEREAELRRKTRAMDEAPVGITITDPSMADNPIRYANGQFEELTGYDEREVLGRNCRFLQGSETNPEAVAEIREALDREEPVQVELLNYRKDGTPFWNRLAVAPVEDEEGTVVNWVGFQEDVTERTERERAIEDLHDTAQELLGATSPEAVASMTVEAVRDILGMPASGFHLYDADEDVLRPVAWSDQVEDIIGTPPTFGPGEGLAREAFEAGETRRYDDVSTIPGRRNPDTDVRSQISIPLGEHGVIIVGSTEVGAFEETDVSLARTLAAHVTTALDRIERERDLREERRFVDQALDALADVFYVLDPDGGLRRWNDRLTDVTGYTDEEVAGMDALEFFPPEEHERVTDSIETVLTTGRTTLEADVRTADGQRVPHEFVGTRLTDAAGTPIGIVGIARDISDRIERERELRERRSLLEAISTALPDYLFVYDADGEYLDVVTGWRGGPVMYEPEELVGLTAGDVLDPEAAETVEAAIDDALATEEMRTVEYPVETKHGTYRYEGSVAPIPGGYEGREAVVLVARDITDRIDRERSLAALHAVAADLDDATSVEAVCERTIEASQEILAFDLSAIDIEDDGVLRNVAASDELPPEALTDIPVEEGLVGRTYRTGESMVVDDLADREEAAPQETYRSLLSVPIGDHGVFQAVATDTGAFTETDRELAELLLSHAEGALDRIERERDLQRQNDRLDEFASIASHDLRNPLSVAEGQLELAREDCDSDHLDSAVEAVERSQGLIDDLLTLAREGERGLDPEGVALADVLEGCWRTVGTDRATLVVETDRTLLADRGRLVQLLENLLGNAVEHGGEAVTVTVGEIDDGAGFYVADDGPGIPESEREAVFESGYSSDPQGTGYGLHIVRAVADAHGWSVRATESVDGGARFEVTGVETPGE